MWESKKYLSRCSELNNLGFKSSYEPGTKLGRGFADLGFEEYCLLTNNRLLSLFTGSITELSETERRHFFEIPGVDRMINRIHELGWDVLGITTKDQRSWELSMCKDGTNERRSIAGDSIGEVTMEALFLALT